MPTHYDGTAEETRVLNAYIKLVRAADTLSARLLEKKSHGGLSISQFGTLEALYHLGPMLQKEIGEKILKSSGNITMVIDNLEKKGFVQRVRDADDRRCMVVSLTDRGRKEIKEILPDHVNDIVQMFRVLDAEEQEELGALCRKLGRGIAEKGN